MEFYSTYLVRICRRDENANSLILGTIEEIGTEGRGSATFTNFKELQSLLSMEKAKAARMKLRYPD